MAGVSIAVRQAIADVLAAGGYRVEHVLPENVRQVGVLGLYAVPRLEPYTLEAFSARSWELTVTVWLAARHADAHEVDALLEGALERLLIALPVTFATSVPAGGGELFAVQSYEVDVDNTSAPVRGVLKVVLQGSYHK